MIVTAIQENINLHIDHLYMQLCTVLEKEICDNIPSFTIDSREYVIPGITEHVKDLHSIARAEYCS